MLFIFLHMVKLPGSGNRVDIVRERVSIVSSRYRGT